MKMVVWYCNEDGSIVLLGRVGVITALNFNVVVVLYCDVVVLILCCKLHYNLKFK